MKENNINQHSSGFTLLELMITMAIFGILSLIAVTSYKNYVVKTRRASAQIALVNLISQAEAYYLQHDHTYPTDLSSLFMPKTEYYTFSAESCGEDCFKVVACAKNAQWEEDKACQSMTLNTKGARTPIGNICY